MLSFSNYLVKNEIAEELQFILQDIVNGSIEVAEAMRMETKGYAGSENVHGEKQLKLDIFANDVFVNILRKNKAVCTLASEELVDQIDNDSVKNGYAVAFDPLDGSSLVDVNFSIGSIFGIYEGKDFVGKKGDEQVSSLIFIYGPRLTFLVSVGKGVDEFIYDPEKKDFVLNQAQLRLAEEFKMFSPGNLRACGSENWYVELLSDWVKSGYTLRYSGGMVPDVNQILKKGGGIFTYPGYLEKPEGKLRLLYECAPMAFLVEQAGGLAVTKDGRILDIEVTSLHQRTPIFLGSKKEVEKVISCIKK